MARNLFQKVWDAHAVRELPNGQTQLFIALHQCHPVLNRRVEVALQYGGHALWSGRPPNCGGSRACLRMRSLPLGFGEALSEYPTTFSPSVSGFWLKRRVWLLSRTEQFLAY